MDYTQIKIPFLKAKSIKNTADRFRQKYWGNIIPIDIEKISETKLGIDIIPLPDLNMNCDTDAYITSDWASIMVDNAKYMYDKHQNRLRFSIAHEIGHYVLHKEVYSGFNINEIEDFYEFIEQIPGAEYGNLETQANKFASFLLVPREILAVEKEDLLKEKTAGLELLNVDDETLNSYIAGPLASKFGVSPEVIEIALK